jgi:hypothetical protein
MCTVSMVADHYQGLLTTQYPWIPQPNQTTITEYVMKHEFEALKRDVENMKALLQRAKEYDERNGEPHCEMDEKVDLLKRIAKAVGVDLSDVFPAE